MFKTTTSLASNVLLIFLVSIFIFHSSVFALSGGGTETDPYLITSLAEFDEFANNSSFWDDHVRLDCDIDLSGTTYPKAVIASDTSTSDGFQGTSFSGCFNGNGHTLSNLMIDAGTSGNDYLGLFGQIAPLGQVSELTVNNFGVMAASPTNPSVYAGAICGENIGTISNCDVTGSISIDYSAYVGSLTGQNSGGYISDCTASVNIEVGVGSGYIGGIAGVNASLTTNSSIVRCSSSGVIQGGYDSNYFGGIVGTNWVAAAGVFSTVSSCSSSVNVTGGDNSDYLGGIVGLSWEDGTTVGYCYATGNITSGANSMYVGGLCGANNEGGFIFDSYATGSVSGYDRVGGFCGYNVTDSGLYNCYSTGAVTGTINVGGFCGRQFGAGSEMRNCFWDTETSGTTVGYVLATTPGTVENVEGKTTTQMYNSNTFLDAGWDYVGETINGTDDIWRTPYQSGYPILHWQRDIPGDYTGQYGVNLEDFSVFADKWLTIQTAGDELMKLTASDGAQGDYFGRAVSADGNIAIVGAFQDGVSFYDYGSAYLFDVTTGIQLRKLTASDANHGDDFGYSVAIDGDVAIVGAKGDDEGGLNVGAAYLFDITTGNQLAKLMPSDPTLTQNEYFGYSVAIDGNLAIVGAYGNDTAGSDSGSAYVFNVTTGSQTVKLTASDATAGDEFGKSVAINGNIAIVGAPGKDDGGLNSGAAYLFDATTGSQIAKVTALDAAENDYFGQSVAIESNVAIVGAHRKATVGAAYLFNITTGSQLMKLTASDAAENDYFGYSVDIKNDIAVVGAMANDDGGSNSGSAYLFDVATGNQLKKLIASDAAENDRFGYSVSIGDALIIGAYGNDTYTGAAYLFDLNTKIDLGELLVLCENWLAGITVDVLPPEPNPAIFSSSPTAVSQNSIEMTATAGIDTSGPVEYYFAELSGNPGGDDSGWQLSETYMDTGLDPNTQYTYTVQIRDSAGNAGTVSNPAAATTLAATDPPSDMAVYWSFDNVADTGHDDTGNGYDGNVYEAQPISDGSRQALSFDGINDYMDSNFQMTDLSSSKTINFWLKTTTTATRHIFSCYDGNDYLYVFLNRSPGTISYGLYDGSNEVEVYTTNMTYQNGNWHMVTITQDGTSDSNINMYLDGVSQSLTHHASGTLNSDSVDKNMFIGARNNNGTAANFVNASLDEIKIWNRALSVSEIQSLYQNP
ncbi:MAG: hypothetical protein JXR78_09345 [Victivallales bacterium]|nr:hypothetical protein [Victivallales bacterium]